MSIICDVSEYLCFSLEETLALSKKAPSTYKKYYVPKRKGGSREIHHPSKQTKALQYALIELLLRKLSINEACAMGYIRGLKSPLLKNALAHSSYLYSVRVDFKDFFPSIRSIDLVDIIKKHPDFSTITQNEIEFMVNVLFIKKHGAAVLAIGAPASPIISNIVMAKLDDEISLLAKELSPDSAYTRYADDIVFSTNIKNGCKQFVEKLALLLDTVDSPKLTINLKKTYYSSRATRRTITGLTISPLGSISIGRGKKRYIKKCVFDFQQNKLSSEKIKFLQGYISYILDVDPKFYNALVLKYSALVIDKIKAYRLS